VGEYKLLEGREFRTVWLKTLLKKGGKKPESAEKRRRVNRVRVQLLRRGLRLSRSLLGKSQAVLKGIDHDRKAPI